MASSTSLTVISSVIFQLVLCAVNDQPVIGILGMSSLDKAHGDEFILASYVKYLESGGAQVVPVRGNQSESYYQNLFKKINGVLFPGGHDDPHYERSAALLYKMAIKANLAGDYFPIWGTCEGFEELVYLEAQKYILNDTDTENLNLPLKFLKGFEQSRLFQNMPKDLIYYLSHENVTQNSHQHSLLYETYLESSMSKFYQALSTNIDSNKKVFVSTMEAKQFPFYATQWHPEKNMFQWVPGLKVSHGLHAVEVSQYMANFFVNEARKNSHHFDKPHSDVIIENYTRLYKPSFMFGPTYFFKYHS